MVKKKPAKLKQKSEKKTKQETLYKEKEGEEGGRGGREGER